MDGQKRYLQTDPAVVTAVNGMGLDSSNMYRSLLRLPAAFARSAFTVMDFVFFMGVIEKTNNSHRQHVFY